MAERQATWFERVWDDGRQVSELAWISQNFAIAGRAWPIRIIGQLPNNAANDPQRRRNRPPAAATAPD
jgi:hypothetical protein